MPHNLMQNLQSTISNDHHVRLHDAIPLFTNTLSSLLNCQNFRTVNAKSFIKIREISKPKSNSVNDRLPPNNHRFRSQHPASSIDVASQGSNSHSRSSKHEETKISSQIENNKNNSVSNRTSLSRLEDCEDTDKNDYIKAIFEVIKIDKKSNREIKLTKHRHIISHCPHTTSQYYAKGMCKKCYFSRGQLK